MRSYGKVFNLGHAALNDLLVGTVVVQEKIDGSQFSFGAFDDHILLARSRSKNLDVDAPAEKMFDLACQMVRERAHLLHPNWTYRGEFLAKPKHNTLAYDRAPNANVILFDIDTGYENYLDTIDLAREAERIGLESVPVMFEGPGEALTMQTLDTLLEVRSVLGGSTVEGVVIKAYGRFGKDGHTLMGKHVSERFKEMNKANWRTEHPAQSDIITTIGQALRTEARWEKAVQHLRERGELLDDPKDIGPLLAELELDLKVECAEEVRVALMKWAWPNVVRQVRAGFPEYYKRRLAERQFNVQHENKPIEGTREDQCSPSQEA